MNPILIAAGIYVSAKIVNFIYDIISEEDVELKSNIDFEMEEIKARADSIDDVAKLQKNHLIKEAKSRIEMRKDFDEEIGKTLLLINELLDERTQKVFLTPIRKNSLYTLKRQITEAKYKNLGYIDYLKNYCVLVLQNKSLPACFEMRIPNNYPYYGKIIWLETASINDNCAFICDDSTSNMKYELRIIDYHRDEFANCNKKIPIMVSFVGEKFFVGSYSYGFFHEYELMDSSTGIRTTVESINRGGVILSYNESITLFLPFSHLKSYNQCPLIKTDLLVYPVEWEYGLNCNSKNKTAMVVSEKDDYKGIELGFSSIPLYFDEEDIEPFFKYLKDNNLQDSEEEWLLGPILEDNIVELTNARFKLQLGNHIVGSLKLVEVNSNIVFKFESFLDSDLFSPEDVFVPIEASLAPCSATVNNDTICEELKVENMNVYSSFAFRVLEELSIQIRIKNNAEGISYFNRWERLLDSLISYNKDESVLINIRWFNKREKLCAHIKNMKQVTGIYSQKIVDENHIVKLYIKDNNDRKYEVCLEKDYLFFKNDISYKQEYFLGLKELELFFAENNYLEIKQKNALQDLRTGKICNPSLMLACLNGKEVVSISIPENTISEFKNDKLSSNDSQRKAVEQSFGEKNIYAIQGPPGTGKTTVIKELVYQQLKRYPSSRVLIVSQSNAAVDNALEGLVADYKNEIIRCGSTSKIQSNLLDVSIDTIFEKYLQQITASRAESNKDIVDEWLKLINPSGQEYSAALREILVRNYKIVGATCMGLLKRDISLSKIDFDLVIVDEAGKALPAELVIPTLSAKKIIYIGDQNQLPPVIDKRLFDPELYYSTGISDFSDSLFSESLFERIIRDLPIENKCLLGTQYRMPASVGTIVSNLFYGGMLKNGENTYSKKPLYHSNNIVFYNFDKISEYHEEKASESVVNYAESKFIAEMINKIRQKNESCSISVITPYRGQKKSLKN